jgi:hypothetical protein
VPHCKNNDLSRVVVHTVDDPVVTHSYAPIFLLPCPPYLDGAAGSGIFGEIGDGPADSFVDAFGETY